MRYSSLYAQQTASPFQDFPSIAQAKAMNIHIVAKTEADSVQSAAVHPDISGFKGWVPAAPRLYAASGSRVIPVSWDTQDVYDFAGCQIQIAAAYKIVGGKYAPITNPAELVWYAPALGANPYESIESYKTGPKDGFLPVEGTNIAFTVPLYGQPDGSVATMYAFRARAFSKRGSSVISTSEWCAPFFVQARPTSAADVVKAWKLNDKGGADGRTGFERHDTFTVRFQLRAHHRRRAPRQQVQLLGGQRHAP